MKENENDSNDSGAATEVSSIISFGVAGAIGGAIVLAIVLAIVGAAIGFLRGFDLFNLISLGDHIKEGAIEGAVQGAKLGAIVSAIAGAVIGGLLEATEAADAKRADEARKAQIEAERRADREAYPSKTQSLGEACRAEHEAKAEEKRIKAAKLDPELYKIVQRWDASKVAQAGSSREIFNVPVQNYKQLPKLEAPAGYVYVIKDVTHTQSFKIGHTKHPRTRINEFGIKLPFETEVVAILQTDDAKALEQRLHRKFAKERKRGEWFDLTASQVREIQRM